ncbi:MAG: PIN domain nuclease [Gammaproteobacteria bacterium]|nr:MAG: PIN domain nuclease [Gammaproteobacteria bacterium]
MILLDTHALVWLSEGNSKLGTESLSLIDKALKENELFVSAISFWEVAMLSEKGRVTMECSISEWRSNLMKHGLQEIAVAGDVAIESTQLADFHGDPADRMIVATAIKSAASLCTADQKILDWDHRLATLNAKR